MNNYTFKVAFGQEWKNVVTNKTLVIYSIMKLNAYSYGGFYANVAEIRLTINNTVLEPDIWKYVGTPVRCEDCLQYCNQNNCVFSSYNLNGEVVHKKLIDTLKVKK